MNVPVGGDLAAFFQNASSSGCVFVPLQVNKAVRLEQPHRLESIGTFAIMVNCTSERLIIADIITIACNSKDSLSHGRCVPDSQTCGPDEARIGSLCKKQPRLHVLSDALALFVIAQTSAVQWLTVQLTLEGSFDVEWRAQAGTGAASQLLRLLPDAGNMTAPDGPERTSASLQLQVDGTKQKDFSIAGDLHSVLSIEGSSHPQISFEGKSIMVPVRVRVEAQACVRLQDVQVQVGARGRRSVDSTLLVEGVEPNSNVIVYVRSYDCQRFPIERPLNDRPLHLRLSDGGTHTGDLTMAYAPTEAEKNLHEAMLPQAWVNDTRKLQLIVFANASDALEASEMVTFTIVITSKWFPVWQVVGVVIAVGMAVLFLFLLHILLKNRDTATAIFKAYMKFEVRLGIEMGKTVVKLAASFCAT